MIWDLLLCIYTECDSHSTREVWVHSFHAKSTFSQNRSQVCVSYLPMISLVRKQRDHTDCSWWQIDASWWHQSSSDLTPSFADLLGCILSSIELYVEWWRAPHVISEPMTEDAEALLHRSSQSAGVVPLRGDLRTTLGKEGGGCMFCGFISCSAYLQSRVFFKLQWTHFFPYVSCS